MQALESKSQALESKLQALESKGEVMMVHLAWNTFLCHWSDLPCHPLTEERALKLHKGHPVTTNSCLSARFALICLLCHQALSEEVPFVRDAGT